MEGIQSAEKCETACRFADKCEYFVYKVEQKACQLLSSSLRNCDLLKGLPYPTYNECKSATTTTTMTTTMTTTSNVLSSTTAYEPSDECSIIGCCEVMKPFLSYKSQH